MTVKIKTTKLDDKATLKNVLLKLENGKLNHLEFIRRLTNEHYVGDVLKICKSCGIVGVKIKEPGLEQCAISMSINSCENSSIKKRLFRLLAEDVDCGSRHFFPSCSDDEPALISKSNGLYKFVIIPYQNNADVFFDLELLAIQIIAKSEPELGLIPLATLVIETNAAPYKSCGGTHYIKGDDSALTDEYYRNEI